MAENPHEVAWNTLRARLDAYLKTLDAYDKDRAVILQVLFTMDTLEPSSEDHE